MNLQELEAKLQNSSAQFSLRAIQVITTVYVSVLMIESLRVAFGFGILAYVFCLLTIQTALFNVFKLWGLPRLAIFNVIVVLAALVLRTYLGEY